MCKRCLDVGRDVMRWQGGGTRVQQEHDKFTAERITHRQYTQETESKGVREQAGQKVGGWKWKWNFMVLVHRSYTASLTFNVRYPL